MGQHSHVVLRNLRLLHRSGICPVELTPGRPWTAVGDSWRPWTAMDGRPYLTPLRPPPPHSYAAELGYFIFFCAGRQHP